jgi:hypothetical protein
VADKRVKELVRTIRSWEDWRLVEVSDGYYAYSPDKTKKPVGFHKTPGDRRWYVNTVTALRRAGGPI